MGKIFIATFFFLLFGPNFTFAALTYNSPEFQKLIVQFDMQGHADHDISNCTVKKVYFEEVIQMLNEGKSEKQIVQSYVDEYGQAALRTPGTDGKGLLAWAMPALGVVVGGLIVVTWMIRKSGKTQIHETANQINWTDQTEKEIFEKTMDEERRKFF